MMRKIIAVAAVLGAFGLAGCAKRLQAPTDAGVCWQLVSQNGQYHFNQLSDHEPSIEACASSLEGMRLRFLGLGGSSDEITGAYQGRFLFLTQQGIFTSDSLDGVRYLLLVRANGELVMPGALQLPPQQQQPQ